jgi:hypothetical protein
VGCALALVVAATVLAAAPPNRPAPGRRIDVRVLLVSADGTEPAVILSTGDLGRAVTNPDATISYLSAFTDAEWATLAKFERTFGIRQLSDYTAPGPAHGLATVGGAAQDGVPGTLTAAGRAAFPYRKGPVPIADGVPEVVRGCGSCARPATSTRCPTLLRTMAGAAA